MFKNLKSNSQLFSRAPKKGSEVNDLAPGSKRKEVLLNKSDSQSLLFPLQNRIVDDASQVSDHTYWSSQNSQPIGLSDCRWGSRPNSQQSFDDISGKSSSDRESDKEGIRSLSQRVQELPKYFQELYSKLVEKQEQSQSTYETHLQDFFESINREFQSKVDDVQEVVKERNEEKTKMKKLEKELELRDEQINLLKKELEIAQQTSLQKAVTSNLNEWYEKMMTQLQGFQDDIKECNKNQVATCKAEFEEICTVVRGTETLLQQHHLALDNYMTTIHDSLTQQVTASSNLESEHDLEDAVNPNRIPIKTHVQSSPSTSTHDDRALDLSVAQNQGVVDLSIPHPQANVFPVPKENERKKKVTARKNSGSSHKSTKREKKITARKHSGSSKSLAPKRCLRSNAKKTMAERQALAAKNERQEMTTNVLEQKSAVTGPKPVAQKRTHKRKKSSENMPPEKKKATPPTGVTELGAKSCIVKGQQEWGFAVLPQLGIANNLHVEQPGNTLDQLGNALMDHRQPSRQMLDMFPSTVRDSSVALASLNNCSNPEG